MVQAPYFGGGHETHKRRATIQNSFYAVTPLCPTYCRILLHFLVLFRAGLGVCIWLLIAKMHVEPRSERSQAQLLVVFTIGGISALPSSLFTEFCDHPHTTWLYDDGITPEHYGLSGYYPLPYVGTKIPPPDLVMSPVAICGILSTSINHSFQAPNRHRLKPHLINLHYE